VPSRDIKFENVKRSDGKPGTLEIWWDYNEVGLKCRFDDTLKYPYKLSIHNQLEDLSKPTYKITLNTYTYSKNGFGKYDYEPAADDFDVDLAKQKLGDLEKLVEGRWISPKLVETNVFAALKGVEVVMDKNKKLFIWNQQEGHFEIFDSEKNPKLLKVIGIERLSDSIKIYPTNETLKYEGNDKVLLNQLCDNSGIASKALLGLGLIKGVQETSSSPGITS
jgi:hypothetical protein